MRIFKIIVSVLVFMFAVTSSSALANSIKTDNGSTLIADADSAYSRGEFDRAVELYNEVIHNQGISSNLYVNLGNAQYKRGNTGEAVIAYLRALRLDPSNKVAKSNLNFLRSFVIDSNRAEIKEKKGNVEPDSPSFWRSLYNHISSDHLPNTWAAWAVVCFLCLVAAGCCYVFSSNVLIRKIGFFSGLLFLIGTVLLVICAYSAAKAWNKNDVGVIIENKTALRTQPGDTASAVGTVLHGGTELTVASTDSVDGKIWYNCRLNNDMQGWVSGSEFEMVTEL
ncbi:MAG: tetratricopeptide repeat protein [Muribaculum sp.]|nr:tetratricopeptide repeat protein [Muribaculum sp.]